MGIFCKGSGRNGGALAMSTMVAATSQSRTPGRFHGACRLGDIFKTLLVGPRDCGHLPNARFAISPGAVSTLGLELRVGDVLELGFCVLI